MASEANKAAILTFDTMHYLSLNRVEELFEAPTFRLATQRQLQKDFSTLGGSFSQAFQEDPCTFEEMREAVEEQLLLIMQQSERSTLQLLYQVDVPQELFLELTMDPDIVPKLSLLLIQREAYKVYLRTQF